MTSPIPTSSDETNVITFDCENGDKLAITLKPLPEFEKAYFDYEVNARVPQTVRPRDIQLAIMDALPRFFDTDLGGAEDVLTRHFDTLAERAGDEGVEISVSERKQATRIISDIMMADEDVRELHARFGYQMSIQSLMAVAFCVTRAERMAEGGDDGEEVPLPREKKPPHALTKEAVSKLADMLRRADWQILQMQAFNCIYLRESTVKNSAGPSKSANTPSASTSRTRSSKVKTDSKSTAKSTKK